MKSRNPWSWVPTLYFAEGLPYVAVISITTIMYLRLGLTNAEMTFYTGWLYLPWVIKPFWSPFVDILKTKRWWIWTMQSFLGAGMAGIAFTLPTSFYLQVTLAIFWLMAFASATHDIAADGFYMLGLTREKQAFFIGIRNTCYRIAMITGQGFLVMLAGMLEKSTGNIPYAWSIVFYILAGLLVGIGVWHRFILPYPKEDRPQQNLSARDILTEFLNTFREFFKKKGILATLLFILFFRLGESQLLKISSAFLLDTRANGGMFIDTEEVGFIVGTVGILALLAGGILGGIAIACQGLKKWLIPMAISVSLPNALYLYLAYTLPDNLWLVSVCVSVEQFGYGFGVTAFTMYMMIFSEGKYKTSHYALCTGFMALGMMVPGMVSGWIQQQLRYMDFFIWVMICCIPVFFVIPVIKKLG
ncbi:MAG: MFS transporter [Tannerellaceae bacterium]|nr:MFS transporter [Tannerellaceae bacterium]